MSTQTKAQENDLERAERLSARAAEVFGGREEAERWMLQPAMGLDGARPIDLLQTAQGADLVEQFLVKLEYGVYI